MSDTVNVIASEHGVGLSGTTIGDICDRVRDSAP